MKHSILMTTGMVASLLFTSSAAMAASHGDKQRIQPQKHTTSSQQVKKSYTKSLKGVNVARLEYRIKKGVKQGKLTRNEARIAKNGVKSLKATIKAVKKDRKITRWESNRVQQKSAQLKRKISRLINNKTVAKRAKYSQKIARR